MEGSVSSSASQPPGESPWKIAASHKQQRRQGSGSRGERAFPISPFPCTVSSSNSKLSNSKYVQCLENLLKADPVVNKEQIKITDKAGTLRDSQERMHCVDAAAITNLISLTRSANEATAGIAANPISRI